MFQSNLTTTVNTPEIHSRVTFMYPGVPFYYERRPMTATVVDIEPDGDDYRYLVRAPELNLPRWLRLGEMLSIEAPPPVYFPGGLTDEHAARLCWFNAHGMSALAAAAYAHHYLSLTEGGE